MLVMVLQKSVVLLPKQSPLTSAVSASLPWSSPPALRLISPLPCAFQLVDGSLAWVSSLSASLF